MHFNNNNTFILLGAFQGTHGRRTTYLKMVFDNEVNDGCHGDAMEIKPLYYLLTVFVIHFKD